MSTSTPPGFVPAYPRIGEAALAWALTQLGVCETRRNSGPEIDAYLATVTLPPGDAWCAAFVVTGLQEGAGKLGIPATIPVTGSCLHLWERAVNARHQGMPQVGDVYVLKHSQNTGHVGFVERVTDDGFHVVSEISGNTFNDRGGREGDCVARHYGAPEKTHGGELMGYLRF